MYFIFLRIRQTFIFIPIHILLWTVNRTLCLDDSTVLHFFVTEEVRKGTVVASGMELSNIYQGTVRDPPRIINQADPGVACFSLLSKPIPPPPLHGDLGMHDGPNLQLVVSERLDRETLCPTTSSAVHPTASTAFLQYTTLDFLVESNHAHSEHLYDSGMADMLKPGLTHSKDCPITLRVASTDGLVQSISQIIIFVQDINDNAPTWSKPSIELYFRDGDAAGTKQPIPLASDPDHELNALISYRLQDADHSPAGGRFASPMEGAATSATDMFDLVKEPDSATNGAKRLYLVARHDLDRETHPRGWDLLVIATNVVGGPGIHSFSQLLVHINITDINDNAPVFSQSIYQPQLANHRVGVIPETLGVGQVVVQLHASDADEGANGAITYDFAPSSQTGLLREFFQLNRHGELLVKQRLQVDVDPHQSNVHLPTTPLTFDVIAVDGAEPAYAKTGIATVKVQVEDVDDEAPLIRVHPIHPWTSVNRSAATTSTTTNLWSNWTELSLTENDPVGQLLALVEVIDPDRQGQDAIRCSLEGKSAAMFRLTQKESGRNEHRLYTAVRFDRETNPRVTVGIECRDLADHVSTYTVGVNVLDVNDHAPIFDQTTYQFSVFEDDGELDTTAVRASERRWVSDSGRVFVKAHDLDDGQNSLISYHIDTSLNHTDSLLFSVDTRTGELHVSGVLDREERGIHEFIVLAIDGGLPKRTGTCAVHVLVLDVNDNAPIFTSQHSTDGSYAFTCMENQLPGKRIGQVTAYDLDQLPAPVEKQEPIRGKPNEFNDQISYGLKDEPDAKPFWIDPKSGILTTRAMLDREKQSVYTLHVTARDGAATPGSAGNPRMRGRIHEVSATVTVMVGDENDNDPVFVRPNATNHMVLLDPGAIPGQSLLQLLATDPDEGANGMVTYAIKGGNAHNLFNVDPRTGLLYLENAIPRKTVVEAKQAANVPPASAVGPRFGAGVLDTEHSNANSPVYLASHPTFLIALEACDQGERRRCSHFPNLQIQLRVPSDVTPHWASASSVMSDDAAAAAAASRMLGAGGEAGEADLFFGGVGGLRDRSVGPLSTLEIVIITLSVFFTLVLFVAAMTVCALRRRVLRTGAVREEKSKKSPCKRKLDNPNVELGTASTSMQFCANMSVPPSETMVPASGKENKWFPATPMGDLEVETLARAGMPRFDPAHAFPESIGYMMGQTSRRNGPPYGAKDYGFLNASTVGNGYGEAEQYQSLESWSADGFRRHGLYAPQPAVRHLIYTPPAQGPGLSRDDCCDGFQQQPTSDNFTLRDNSVPDTEAGRPTQTDVPRASLPPQSTDTTKSGAKMYFGFPQSSFV